MLMTHQDFDKIMSKHLPANTLRNVREIVENLRIKVRIHQTLDVLVVLLLPMMLNAVDSG